LLGECHDRDRRRSARRVKAARFPREKWLEDFDFDANPSINPATINTLTGGAWIKAGEQLCRIGDADERQLAKTIARYGRSPCTTWTKTGSGAPSSRSPSS
jgi:hypothetical protein